MKDLMDTLFFALKMTTRITIANKEYHQIAHHIQYYKRPAKARNRRKSEKTKNFDIFCMTAEESSDLWFAVPLYEKIEGSYCSDHAFCFWDS